MNEKVTILINARNRFSTTSRCLESLIAHTPAEATEIIAVMGGTPAHLQKEWQTRFSHKVRFSFKSDFLLGYNAQIGFLPRLFPSRFALWLDRRIGGIRGLIGDIRRAPRALFRRQKAKWMGYDEWPVPGKVVQQ